MAQDPFAQYAVPRPTQPLGPVFEEEDNDPFAQYTIPTPKEEPPTLLNQPRSVISDGWLSKFNTPLSNIGRKAAAAITPKTQPVESPYQEPLPTGLPDLLGGALDTATAPINMLPGGLFSLAKKTQGAVSSLLNLGGRIASVPTMLHGQSEMRNAETPTDVALGALETAGGIAGMRGVKPNLGNKTSKAFEELSKPIESPEEYAIMKKALDNFYDRADNLTADELKEAQALNKRVRAHPLFGKEEVAPVTEVAPDPNYPDLPPDVPKTEVPKTEQPILGGQASISLPRELAGAKPRFYFGRDAFFPQFESDIDKALYIIAQKKPSKRDADYLKFVMEQTGLNEEDARKLAQEVRNHVVTAVKDAQVTGDVPIKRFYQPKAGGTASMHSEDIGDEFGFNISQEDILNNPKVKQGLMIEIANSMPNHPQNYAKTLQQLSALRTEDLMELMTKMKGPQTPVKPDTLAQIKPAIAGKPIQFEDDVQKALWVIGDEKNTNNPLRQQYLEWLKTQSGLDENTIKELAIKQNLELATKAKTWPENTPVAMGKKNLADMAFPDYGTDAQKTAMAVLQANGINPKGLSHLQIVDNAKALLSKRDVAQDIAGMTAEIQTGKMPKPKVKSIGNGEFIPDGFPDVVIDSQGRVVRTLSGQPVRLPEEVKRNIVADVMNLPRAIQASMDLSFPFRQGLGLIHTKGWWQAWPEMVRAFGSDKAYQGTMDAIRQRELFRPRAATDLKGNWAKDSKGLKLKPSIAEEAGLVLADRLTIREHEYMSQMAEKIPGMGRMVKASNRAYTAFANKLRADTFESLVKSFGEAGIDVTKDKKLAEQLATFVNNASGRGDLGEWGERHAAGLNAAFFSPRLMSARVQNAAYGANAAVRESFDFVKNPMAYAMAPPNVRQQYLKSNIALGTAWTTMASMAAAAGGEVVMDSTNADFGKMKFGDTRLEPSGGVQPWVVLASRIANLGMTKSTEPDKFYAFSEARGPYDPTLGSTLGNFAANKSSPLMKYVYDLINARRGNRAFDTADRTARLVVPIIVQDLAEILNSGNTNELATLPFEAVGIGSNTYNQDDLNRRMLPGDMGKQWTYPRPKVNIFNR